MGKWIGPGDPSPSSIHSQAIWLHIMEGFLPGVKCAPCSYFKLDTRYNYLPRTLTQGGLLASLWLPTFHVSPRRSLAFPSSSPAARQESDLCSDTAASHSQRTCECVSTAAVCKPMRGTCDRRCSQCPDSVQGGNVGRKWRKLTQRENLPIRSIAPRSSID